MLQINFTIRQYNLLLSYQQNSWLVSEKSRECVRYEVKELSFIIDKF